MPHEGRCIDCARFTPCTYGDAKYGLGHCSDASLAWDGFSGQWPQRPHPCASYYPRPRAACPDGPVPPADGALAATPSKSSSAEVTLSPAGRNGAAGDNPQRTQP